MEIDYPKSKVIYGENSIEWLANLHKKALVVTSRSLLKSKILDKILNLVEADVIEGPKQHTPEDDVKKLSNFIQRYEIVIGLGGGSIIDGIKLANPKYFIAIPTTLSGSEHTKNAGFTVEGTKTSKEGKEADVVILDPYTTLETPKWLLLSSGIRALDHAIEALYSNYSNLFSDSLAIEGYRKLIDCLPKIDSIQARLDCQIGEWLSSLTMRYVKMGMSHMFGYVYGPRFNIPHGITSCISLPEAIKINYQASKQKIKAIENDEPLYQFIYNFLKSLNIIKRLSEYTIFEEALKYIDIFIQFTNNSGNPIKIDEKIATQFLEEVY
ncbi:iron-containing alcohol dehydrogenase [Acidianus manzaensis]|uniref:Alcohol dehydrogenase n=1 Tax=Acidianus manzaensis TaxID=282676 RepID=A0A1W6JZ03_9CREN|nr:iron-containing alcohol dehydrogenase [Acidianus manzaensis]ARM75488.1 alcohol dehydrogenase [Acidianus manzaensis]